MITNMADNADDLQNIKFIFRNNENPNKENIDTFAERISVYLGETIGLFVVSSRDVESETVEQWKSKMSHFAAVASFSIIDDTHKLKLKSPRKPIIKSESNFITCPIAVTLSADSLKSDCYSEHKKEKPYFLDDDHYLLPIKASLKAIDGNISKVNLSVTAWMCTSPLDPTPDQIAKKDFHLDNLTLQILKKKTIQQKTVTKTLNVINPPLLKIKVTSAGGKHMLLAQVNNNSNQNIQLHDITIITTSSKYSIEDSDSLDSTASSTRSTDYIQSQVSFCKLGSYNLPCVLLPEEEMCFVFTISVENLNSSISEMELNFKSQLKWCHSSSETNVITVYRLPKCCLRYAPFVISIDCTEEIKLGKSFTLTYNIVNKLQDFLSMKLYWNLKHQLDCAKHNGIKGNDIDNLEKMNRAVICHDPDVYVGACPKGSSIPVPVSFQILEPGLFEFSELMKVNLRYALPESHSTLKQDSLGTPLSNDTTSTLSGEDQLAASEELWRDRSGSTSSLNTPVSDSAEEKRKSFATKSYSFGDLGPTLSTDSEESKRTKFKNIKRSSAVPPPRPPPPKQLSQLEKDITNPSNFLKKSFQVYIPSV